jgi:NAD(P)H-dependent FMN reductase
MAITIVALGGSLAKQSTSLAAVRIALEGASEAGAHIALYDVRQLDLPMYVPNATDVPDAARVFCDSVYARTP